MTFGERLQQARKDKGYSLRKLSLKIGVSWEAIHRWEWDKRSPKTTDLKLLCIALGVSADWLLGLKEKSAPNAATFKGADEKTS